MARERAEASAIRLAIADAETDQLLGAAALKRFDWTVPTAELRYWVAPRARGRGVGRRAVRLLVQGGFADIPVSELTARTDLDNYASQRRLERQGFNRLTLQPVGDPPLATYAIQGTALATSGAARLCNRALRGASSISAARDGPLPLTIGP